MARRKRVRPCRTPDSKLKEALRSEVNFGCPVRYSDGTGCGCPILTFHHFDPPWAGNFVHNPNGMIALCKVHHDQADGGAWTKQQLAAMKRNPYVDNVVKVAWPYQTESLVAKIGRSFVVGSGAVLRFRGIRALSFRPEAIPALSTRTVVFDADVRDVRGQPWLAIDNNSFRLDVAPTASLEFTPQTRTFCARHGDNTHLSFRYKKRPLEQFLVWSSGFIDKKEIQESLRTTLDSVGAIDSEGEVPVMEVEGRFRTPEFEVNARGHDMTMRCFIPGLMEEFCWHSWVVDEQRRARILLNGQEVFSLG